MLTNSPGAMSIALTGLLVLGADAASAQDQIQNGKVERRQATAVARELAALPASTEPVWVGWRVPMIPGDRGICSWYGDNDGMIRGMVLDQGGLGSSRPQLAPPSGPLQLEGGTRLVVLLRIVEGRIERLRTAGDDCPIDAQGRTVYWLDGIAPAESLRYLDTLLTMEGDDRTGPLPGLRASIASSALSAIGHHGDAGADTILDRLAAGGGTGSLRSAAVRHLGSLRGARGFASLQRLLAAEQDPAVRRTLTTAIGQTREPGTVEAMRTLTRDVDARVRAEAVYWLAVRGGTAVTPEVVKLIESDPDTTVKRRALSGLSRLPDNAGIAPLLQLARTSTDPVVKKEAVAVLSRSKDPRATAFMEELIKR